MKDDTKELLDGLLVDWHRWANGYQHVGGINTSPTFRECTSNYRQWASLEELADEDKSSLEFMHHIIMELCDVYRTALQINARNLHTGKSVWTSARLPQDEKGRALVLMEARAALLYKMRDAGVL